MLSQYESGLSGIVLVNISYNFHTACIEESCMYYDLHIESVYSAAPVLAWLLHTDQWSLRSIALANWG